MATQTQYIIPALGKIWDGLGGYAWAFLRICYGLWYIPHGMQKLFGLWGGSAAGTAKGMAKVWGLEMGTALGWAYYIACLELFGGILLVIGLFTRPVAALFVGFMYVAAFHFNVVRGYFWTQGGTEMPLLLMAVALVILVRGGGEYSLDRKLGREF
jgi:putative oxidoreductase